MAACSTGSPASRRSTKLTPLTTRPSATSRQGMTRTFSMGDSAGYLGAARKRRSEIDPPVIEGPADDGAGNAGGLQCRQLLDIGRPARGDDGDGEYGGEMGRGGDVDPRQQPVAIDIGEDQRRDPGIGETQREIERRDLARLCPALDGDTPAARIDPDGDLAGMTPAGLAHQGRILERGGAEDNPRDARLDPGIESSLIADAAAELAGNGDCAQDRLHRLPVHRLAGEGAIEIDQMEPGGPGGGKAARLVRRIAIEDRRLAHLAAAQPDHGSLFQVDGGVEDHGARLSPASPGASMTKPKRLRRSDEIGNLDRVRRG